MPKRRQIGMTSFAIIGAIVTLLLTAAPAFAHVELADSDPVAGSTVSAPPEVITLVFSTAAAPAGEGIVVVDAEQQPIAVSVVQSSPETVEIMPDVPLGEGIYGVQWTMKAGDAHPRTGSVTFRIEQQGVSAQGPASDAASTVDPVPDLGLGTESASATGDWLSTGGRWIAMAGALVGIGAFAFAATSLVGTRREVLDAAFWVRRSGLLVVIGTVIEIVGLILIMSVVSSSGVLSVFGETVSGSYGVAALLRIGGGLAMVKGTSLRTKPAAVPAADAASLPLPVSSRRKSVATMVRRADVAEPTMYRLDIQRDRVAMLGLALVAIAFVFDGHTATAGPGVLVRTSSFVHVVAAGVWVGGVVVMVQVLARRKRKGVALDAGAIAIRFSRVASAALVGVAIAGTALAWSILDSPGELVSTSWGRLLILKLLAVCVAAGIGAYNHFVVIPVLEEYGADADASERLRRTTRVEVVVLVIVVAVTAFLVGAAS